MRKYVRTASLICLIMVIVIITTLVQILLNLASIVVWTNGQQEVLKGGTLITGSPKNELHKRVITTNRPGQVNISWNLNVGPGANGVKIDMQEFQDDPDYKRIRNASLRYGVNTFLSDTIGFFRRLADKRPEKCKNRKYPNDLPAVSIIIIFRDESLSSLMRTVYGLLDTCPEHLLKEIILIDDGTKEKDVVIAVQVHAKYLNKVSLYRNERSMGLMNARQMGIEKSSANYFIVLDSHIEFNIGWLEPILFRLVQEPKALLTSHIGVIRMGDMEYAVSNDVDAAFICFEQTTANEQWARYSDEFRAKRNGSLDPIEYCMVPGMMMAMRKDFFLQLGGFDLGMEVWGSEHIEVSVKVWLCGGRVEMVPCSKIGHLYRQTPWQGVEKRSDYIYKNKLRFAEVWTSGLVRTIMLDHLYKLRPQIKPGDLAQRMKIKEQNQCQSYDFFVNKMKEMTHAVYFPSNTLKFGSVYNKNVEKCLDCAVFPGSDTITLIVYSCSGADNQYFVMTEDGRIKNKVSWFSVTSDTEQLRIAKDAIDWWKGSQYRWRHLDSGVIQHMDTGKCLDIGDKEHVVLKDCDVTQPKQIWQWPKV